MKVTFTSGRTHTEGSLLGKVQNVQEEGNKEFKGGRKEEWGAPHGESGLGFHQDGGASLP